MSWRSSARDRRCKDLAADGKTYDERSGTRERFAIFPPNDAKSSRFPLRRRVFTGHVLRCAVASFCLVVASGQASAAQLTKDGRPTAVLIVPDGSDQARAAAGRIHQIVVQMSGATLAIVAESAARPAAPATSIRRSPTGRIGPRRSHTRSSTSILRRRGQRKCLPGCHTRMSGESRRRTRSRFRCKDHRALAAGGFIILSP